MLIKKFKEIRYRTESYFVKFGLWFFDQLSFDKASRLAGKIAVFIGKKIKVNELASKNLSLALPEINEENRSKIIDEMWNNLGRIIGEFSHVCKKKPQEILKLVDLDVDSIEVLNKLKESKKGAIVGMTEIESVPFTSPFTSFTISFN
jgi:KDO2-lipid IV(A) lauroyltransferase